MHHCFDYENTFQTLSSEFQSSLSYAASSSTSSYGNPYLTINSELPDKFRFRYRNEGPHGGLQPIIELHGCDDPSGIYIKASLYTNEEIPRLHVTNCLFGKHCDDGVCWMKLSEDFTAEFPQLPILIKKMDETKVILEERIKQRYLEQGKSISEKNLKKESKMELKGYNSNCVKFCFEAFYKKDENFPVCKKIFSKPVNFFKSKDTVKKLNISRLSRYTGKVTGNEDTILLCDEIDKDDIEIVFFSLDKDQNEDWKENAKFLPTDVHHQVAIYFRTPPFKENIDKDVFIQLRNKSNGMKSNEVKFHYLRCHELEPESIVQQTKKRKRLDLPEGDLSMSLPSSSEIEQIKDFSDLESYLGLKPPLSMSQISTILGESFNDDKPSNELSVEIKDSLTFNSFDEVDFDGLIDNLASLNIKEKTSEGIMNKSCSSEAEQEQMLKSSVINQIKESKKDKFFKFLPTLIAFEDESENNILHLFVLEESEDVSLLLKMLEYAPIDLLNQVNKMHMTPLLIAVSKNLWKIVRILLKHGADPKVKDKNGNNCVHLAAMFNFPFCMREVLASLLGDSTQKYLLDINGLNYDGLAPLHLSIISNSEICTKLLFEANANANITDGKSGKTPLHFAYERSPDLIAFLRTQSEIDPDAKDYSGNIPKSCLPSTSNTSSPIILELNEKVSLKSKCSEINKIGYKDEKQINSCELHDNKKSHISKNEEAFCKELDSNGLWKKLALYVMDEKELNTIAIMDPNPTRTVLNQLKKHGCEDYDKKLKFILEDNELKPYAKLLVLVGSSTTFEDITNF